MLQIQMLERRSVGGKMRLSLNNYRKSVLFGKVWPETKQLFSAPPEVISYISHSKSHLQ